MEALLERPPVVPQRSAVKQATRRGIPESREGQIWANGHWVDLDELEADLDIAEDDLEGAYGGIDGEEFMGTGTAFDTDEAGPVYTPAGS